MTNSSMQTAIAGSSEPRNYNALLVWGLLAIFIGVLFLKNYVSGDLWFLLLAGRYVVENGTVPQQEFFTYIATGKPEIFGGWGFGTIFELIKRGFGTAAIYYAYAGLWATTFLVGIGTWRAGTDKNWRTPFTLLEISAIAAACCVIYYVAVTRSWMRPEITMYLMMGIGFLLFEVDRSKRQYARSLIVYPLLVWLEAWLHTAGIIMLLLPAAYAIESIVGSHAGQRYFNLSFWSHVGRWASCLIACIVLPVFNPNGAAQVYLHVLIILQELESLQPLLTLGGLNRLPLEYLVPTHNLLEYLPAWQIPELMHRFILLLFATLFILTFSKRRLFHACLLVPLGLLALIHNRGLGPWAMILLPLLCALFSDAGEQLKARVSAIALQRLSGFILLGSASGALIVAATFADMGVPRDDLPLPHGNTAIRAAYPLGGNVFASYLLSAPAAYALGSGYRVPIGAHIMFYYPETRQHFVKTASASSGYEAELLQHNVIAVVYEATNGATGEIALLPAMLTVKKQWRLSAVDDEGVTFIRLPDGIPEATDDIKLAEVKLFWHAVQRHAAAALTHPSEQTMRSIAFAAEQIQLIEMNHQAPAQALEILRRNITNFAAQYNQTDKP